MQRRNLGVLAVVAIVVVVGFVIASGGGDDKKSSSGSTATTGTTAEPTGGKPAKPAEPAAIAIVVKDGKPVGGVRDIEVNKGERVRFTVSSDVADEIHVHGYDFMKDVEAGGKVSFDFKAKIDGAFEIELEGRKEQIADLKVNP
jgi:hypothetical protein